MYYVKIYRAHQSGQRKKDVYVASIGPLTYVAAQTVERDLNAMFYLEGIMLFAKVETE